MYLLSFMDHSLVPPDSRSDDEGATRTTLAGCVNGNGATGPLSPARLVGSLFPDATIRHLASQGVQRRVGYTRSYTVGCLGGVPSTPYRTALASPRTLVASVLAGGLAAAALHTISIPHWIPGTSVPHTGTPSIHARTRAHARLPRPGRCARREIERGLKRECMRVCRFPCRPFRLSHALGRYS